MPATLTYPGVYIEEIPSGVRTITGVATSITAFIGRARRGPVNDPVIIGAFGDFERSFGGLNTEYPMTYAVNDFYQNGGSQAVIVRLFDPFYRTAADQAAASAAAKSVADATAGVDVPTALAAANTQNKTIQADASKSQSAKAAAQAVLDAVDAASKKAGATVADLQKAASDAAKAAASATKAKIKLDTLTLEAANEGDWGNRLRARVDYDVTTDKDFLRRMGLGKDDLFNVTVKNLTTGVMEIFRNVSVKDSPQRLDKVLVAQSSLVRVSGDLPVARPKATDDGLTPDQLKVPPFPSDPDKAETDPRSVGVKDADKVTIDNPLTAADYEGSAGDKTGLYALDKTDLINLLCVPPDLADGNTDSSVYASALTYCVTRRAMLIVDPPTDWTEDPLFPSHARDKLAALNLSGPEARNGAVYFPRVRKSDPLRNGQINTYVPCGIIAGIMARTDTARGVWKAPAGLDATLAGIQALQVSLTDEENGLLNQIGINALRSFGINGMVVWGARTLRGADQLGDEYKYIPVRRLALYIEESLYRGTQWVVFEPNDEPLWAQIRLNIGAFMHNLFRQGAFQGKTPAEAYFVKCDKETTTQNDINLGIVNIIVGFAPLKPAEFVVIQIQQIAGQIAT
jgi:phage tail sheath protein FI